MDAIQIDNELDLFIRYVMVHYPSQHSMQELMAAITIKINGHRFPTIMPKTTKWSQTGLYFFLLFKVRLWSQNLVYVIRFALFQLFPCQVILKGF